MIPLEMKAVIDMGLKRPRPCTGKYRDGRPRRRCLWRFRNVRDGWTYAMRDTASLHRFAVCEECGQCKSEHYNYMGLLPAHSPIHRRYWTADEFRTFNERVYRVHHQIYRGPMA